MGPWCRSMAGEAGLAQRSLRPARDVRSFRSSRNFSKRCLIQLCSRFLKQLAMGASVCSGQASISNWKMLLTVPIQPFTMPSFAERRAAIPIWNDRPGDPCDDDDGDGRVKLSRLTFTQSETHTAHRAEKRLTVSFSSDELNKRRGRIVAFFLVCRRGLARS